MLTFAGNQSPLASLRLIFPGHPEKLSRGKIALASLLRHYGIEFDLFGQEQSLYTPNFTVDLPNAAARLPPIFSRAFAG